MTLALSHGGNTVFASETPSSSVLVGTLDGVARIERDGDGWRIAALHDRQGSCLGGGRHPGQA